LSSAILFSAKNYRERFHDFAERLRSGTTVDGAAGAKQLP
jgi:hypothetical protein